jgi:hypothetical protein
LGLVVPFSFSLFCFFFAAFMVFQIYHFKSYLIHMQAREFANELRASTKASRNPTVWLEASTGSSQSAHNADTSSVSEAYAKMLTIFIPLLVDEVTISAYICWKSLMLLPLP